MFNQFTQDVFKRCCPLIEKNFLNKSGCNKWYNSKSNIAKRNMRHAEKRYRQETNNEQKHSELRHIHIIERSYILWEIKLNQCWINSSKNVGQSNMLNRELLTEICSQVGTCKLHCVLTLFCKLNCWPRLRPVLWSILHLGFEKALVNS